MPVKSHAFSMRVMLQCIKSRFHAHPHYSHANTNIDELENFMNNFIVENNLLIAMFANCKTVSMCQD